jgi:hypothetical protein
MRSRSSGITVESITYSVEKFFYVAQCVTVSKKQLLELEPYCFMAPVPPDDAAPYGSCFSSATLIFHFFTLNLILQNFEKNSFFARIQIQFELKCWIQIKVNPDQQPWKR